MEIFLSMVSAKDETEAPLQFIHASSLKEAVAAIT